MSKSTVTVITPATTANIGPGFDCLGVALTIYNQFEFQLNSSDQLKITLEDKNSTNLNLDQDNLLYQAFSKLYQHLGQNTPGVNIKIKLGVPLARGLGSSATAIVGGLVAANRIAGNPLSKQEILDLAIAMEGHPDNVVPAFLGNAQLSVSNGKDWEICPISWHPEIIPVIAIPNFQLSTEAARSVLPSTVTYKDAIFNMAHLGLLIQGLAKKEQKWLKVALADRLHQPYRETLIPGYTEVKKAAIEAGAYGMVISGAGPTLLALAEVNTADKVKTAMKETWEKQGIETEVISAQIDTEGTKIV